MSPEIKAIVSSECAGKILQGLNLDSNWVEAISIVPAGLKLLVVGLELPVTIHAEVQGAIEKPLYQFGRRWDWIRDTLLKVGDQPVVLKISEACVEVIFQY